MFKLQEEGVACCAKDVAEFEAYIHAKLPNDYRDFLLERNGGIPANECDTFKSPMKLPGGNEVTVEAFYTLSKNESKIPNLHKALDAHVGIVPFDAIPIGHDSFGNLVCLDCQTGLVSWVLMEGRFTFDLHRDFEFSVTFADFLTALGPGPYAQK